MRVSLFASQKCDHCNFQGTHMHPLSSHNFLMASYSHYTQLDSLFADIHSFISFLYRTVAKKERAIQTPFVRTDASRAELFVHKLCCICRAIPSIGIKLCLFHWHYRPVGGFSLYKKYQSFPCMYEFLTGTGIMACQKLRSEG